MPRLYRTMAAAACAAVASLSNPQAACAGGALAPFTVTGDAIPAPLGGKAGDAARGLAVIRDRRTGNCLICHSMKLEGESFQGEIAPSLDGVGSRLTAGQIRLRIADPTRVNPDSLMPAYYRVDGLVNVAPEYKGIPVLDAQQIEDIVVYLSGLKD
jgi:L-cysteine S-thiosulfotransferase